MAKKNIFLIDDEKDFCFFVKRNLEMTGEFSVAYANDPDSAINIVQKNPPDLILMDIRMPKKDGLKVLEILKKNKKTMLIPIIMLTAIEDEDTKLKSAYYYSEDYIVKPVTQRMLLTKIKEVFERQTNR